LASNALILGPQHQKLQPTLVALGDFKIWFETHFDTNTHCETYAVVTDAILIFQTCVDLCQLKQIANDALAAPLQPVEEPITTDILQEISIFDA
jgi:hypothetical protein